jgi:glycosyltransferase involved in cell wall biosynthesis
MNKYQGYAMTKKVLIVSLLAEKGSTGVQEHFGGFSYYLTKKNIPHKIITPHTNGFSIFDRLRFRFFIHIVRFFSKEKEILFSRKLLANILFKKLVIYIDSEPGGMELYVYAQDPSSAVVADEVKCSLGPKKIKAITSNFHFNVSEMYEYALSSGVKEGGKLSYYLSNNERLALKVVDRIIFPSKYTQKQIKDRTLDPSLLEKSTIISNFVEDISKTKLKQVNNKKSIDFLSIGTLEYRKNQTYAIYLIAELHRLGHKRTLTIIGNGPDRTKLEKLVDDLDLNNYVSFLGYVENAKNKLFESNFLLHTPIEESFGIVLIEAMRAGIPIFASSVGGIPEVFDDGIEGVYLNEINIKMNAEKIAQFFNKQNYKVIKNNAREKFINCYCVDVLAPVLLRIITGNTFKN